MAGPQCLCVMSFLATLLMAAKAAHGQDISCHVYEDVETRVWKRFQGNYTFSNPTNASTCSATVAFLVPPLPDSNVRLRVLRVWPRSARIKVFDCEGRELGEVSGAASKSNFLESFQSHISLILRMNGYGSLDAHIEHFLVPGSPVNSSATRLTALSEVRRLQSFGYKNGYPNSLHFTYIISVEFGCPVRIEMRDLDLAQTGTENSACSGDYVEVRGALHAMSPWCRGFHSAVSSDSEIVLIFHTDSSGSGRGFELAYWVDCERALSLSPDECQSSRPLEALNQKSFLSWPLRHNYPGRISECSWILTVGADSDFKVMVKFLRLSLHHEDELRLYDGLDTGDYALIAQVGTGSLYRRYHSSGPSLKLVFKSPKTHHFRETFLLAYKRVASLPCSCDILILLEEKEVVLTSPGIQDGVHPRMSCWFTLQAPPDHVISLLSATVYSPTSAWSCPTWFEFDGDFGIHQKVCAGEDFLGRFPITRTNVTITFHVDAPFYLIHPWVYQAKFSFLLKARRGDEPAFPHWLYSENPLVKLPSGLLEEFFAMSFVHLFMIVVFLVIAFIVHDSMRRKERGRRKDQSGAGRAMKTRRARRDPKTL